MSPVIIFIIFVVCLIIAIPVSISLGIAAVLPGAVDPSFTASATYVIRSMLGETVNQNSKDKMPVPNMAVSVLKAILSDADQKPHTFLDFLHTLPRQV